MTNMKLSEEQKKKLLEMCNKLFPEYDVIEFGKKYYPFTDYIWMSKNGNLTIEIHWFEFCMTHLINELAWRNIKTDILADCEYEDARMKYLTELGKDRPTPGQYHPVDYLYSEFLKLKV